MKQIGLILFIACQAFSAPMKVSQWTKVAPNIEVDLSTLRMDSTQVVGWNDGKSHPNAIRTIDYKLSVSNGEIRRMDYSVDCRTQTPEIHSAIDAYGYTGPGQSYYAEKKVFEVTLRNWICKDAIDFGYAYYLTINPKFVALGETGLMYAEESVRSYNVYYEDDYGQPREVSGRSNGVVRNFKHGAIISLFLRIKKGQKNSLFSYESDKWMTFDCNKNTYSYSEFYSNPTQINADNVNIINIRNVVCSEYDKINP